MTDPRAPDSGFSVMEALVAMTVLAVGSVALLSAVEDHTRHVAGLSDRIAARWVAENALAAERLGLAPDPALRRALGRNWAVQVGRRALEGAGLLAVDVSVAPRPGAPGLVRLTGYVADREGGTR